MSQLEPLGAEGQALAKVFTEEDVPKLISGPTDEQILAIVNRDMRLSENDMSRRGMQNRWDEDDRLYLFQIRQQVWEGTRTQRASLGVPLVLEHVNAINPQVQDILFEEDQPYSIEQQTSVPADQQRATEEVLNWELDKADFKREIRYGSHSALLRGTGIWKAFWKWHPEVDYLCPVLEYRERRHIRMPAGLRRPDARKAKFVVDVMAMTIDEIDNLRNDPSYRNIPSREALMLLGVPPQEVMPPTSVVELSSTRNAYGSMNISTEFDQQERRIPDSVDPAKYSLEVVEYTTPDYVWTVLQRKVVIRSEDNRNEPKVRYFSVPFIPVEGQFDGIGIGALNGYEQQLQQGLLNLMLDNMALSIMGMFIRKRGTSIAAQNIRVAPGKIIDADDINDVAPLKFPGIDPTAFNVIAESEGRAFRRSGANEVTVMGSFPQSTGSVGRTAYGMNALAQAASTRIKSFVEAIEEQVIIPFLEFLVETNGIYLDRSLVKEILRPELYKAYDSNVVKSSKMKFKMYGATKMKRRAAMLQSVPQLMQFYQQQWVQDGLKSSFQILNFDELNNMVFDMTGWPNKIDLIRDMTKDEKDKLMSENELVQQLMVDQQRIKMQTDAQIKLADAQNAGRAGRDIIKARLERGQNIDSMGDAMHQGIGAQMANNELNSEMARIQEMQGNGQPVAVNSRTGQVPGQS